jgi:hypothetical protein
MTDALVLQALACRLRMPFYIMASSHLFRGSRWLAWLIRRLGAFSVYREGIDRQAIQQAIDILVAGKRPLVLFPEGALSQTNEHLNALQEGVSFIARSAAAKLERSQDEGRDCRRVYTIPVAIRYVYQGDIETTAGGILTGIEQRLSWQPRTGQCLVERILRVGKALLSLKEQEFLGTTHSDPLPDRLERLINHLLVPVETEWLRGNVSDSVICRVKELRRAILPEMIDGPLPPEEIERRWQQLRTIELAQSLSLYPADYVASRPTTDRILETVERFHEHLNGAESSHGPMKVIIQVGEPIPVNAKRDRGAPVDSLLCSIEAALTQLLNDSADESTLHQTATTTTEDR